MRFKVKVIANSSQQKIEEKDGTLKIHLKAVPMKGKANEELIEVISKHFKVKKSQINILKGHKSNIKEVEVL
ncbi:MAG: DUF167 domain-containing protein [Nanoarchaeota archaeon]|nr:DUF167 domain-containing protein [Nanoarchaeota archaeon]